VGEGTANIELIIVPGTDTLQEVGRREGLEEINGNRKGKTR
jgi:hypothetical protein